MTHTVFLTYLLTMSLVSIGAGLQQQDSLQKQRRPLPVFKAGLAPVVQFGTAGLGAGIAVSFSRPFSARAGGTVFNYTGTTKAGKDSDELQLAFDYTIRLASLHLLFDYYPFRRLDAHLTAGIYYNRNQFSIFGESAKDFKLNDVVFSVDDIGTIQGTVYFQRFAPYAGVGWGHPFLRKRLKLLVDLGLFFQNAPKLDFRTTGMLAPSTDQGETIENNLSPLKYYPILSIGLAYRLQHP